MMTGSFVRNLIAFSFPYHYLSFLLQLLTHTLSESCLWRAITTRALPTMVVWSVRNHDHNMPHLPIWSCSAYTEDHVTDREQKPGRSKKTWTVCWVGLQPMPAYPRTPAASRSRHTKAKEGDREGMRTTFYVWFFLFFFSWNGDCCSAEGRRACI